MNHHSIHPVLASIGSALVLAVAGISPAADLAHFPLEPRFELPPAVATDVVALRWMPGGVLVRLKINGLDAGWFQLGTGNKESFIYPEVAAKLKLPEIPEFGPVTREIQKTITNPAIWGAANYFRAGTVQCGSAVASDARFFTLREPTGKNPASAASMPAKRDLPDGEPCSGVLGWDLLGTLPFLLDMPGLQLTWQRQAAPPEAATRLPLMKIKGSPCVDLMLGDGCKVRALVHASGSGFTLKTGFIKRHAADLWQNARHAFGTESFSPIRADDDALPFDHESFDEPYATRWLEIGYGDHKEMLEISPDNDPSARPGDARFGSKALRHSLALFDGPGAALWLKPAATVPEITLLGKDRPRPSPATMELIMYSAIINDDVAVLGALGGAGVDTLRSVNGNAPLQLACRNGATKVVAALLKAGAPVEPPDGQMFTPLLSACESGNTEIIRLLIHKGANPNRTIGEVSPLRLAAYSGNPAAVEALGPKVKFPADFSGMFTLACQAAQGGNHPLFLKLISKLPKDSLKSVFWPPFLEGMLLAGRQEPIDWVLKQAGADLVKKQSNIPPLIAAIMPTRIGKTDAVREKLVATLLAAGADPNASCKGVTPLLLAARHGNAAIIAQLLAAGAKVSAKDYQQRNALMRAVVADQPAAVIELLLKAGIDPNDVDSGSEMPPLAVCAVNGNVAACRVLLKAGAAPDGDSMMALTPLTAALNPGNSNDPQTVSDAVKVLLEHGAKVAVDDPADSFKGMAIHFAISASRAGLIKDLAAARQPPLKADSNEARDYLARACLTADSTTVSAVLDLGVNPAALDSSGISPLANAASSGRVRNMKLLLDLGVPPDATNPRDAPPIWMAAAHGQVHALRLLLAAGAKPDALHPEKKTTAHDVARARGDLTLIALLKQPAETLSPD
jgi:ankyrin repeat protein